MKKPISRFYLLLVLVPLLLLASMGGYYFLEETAAGSDVVVVPQTPAPPSATPVPVPTPEPTPTPFPEHDITLMAVGDNLMHLGVVASGKQEDGTYDFSMLFQVIVTDRGSEFTDPMKIEADPETGEVQCRVFYSDPMNSSQKSNCEKNGTDRLP